MATKHCRKGVERRKNNAKVTGQYTPSDYKRPNLLLEVSRQKANQKV